MSGSGIAALLVAMTCLALVISDTTARLVKSAERDAATGLLNQNGFEQHGARLVAALPHDAGHEIALALIAIGPVRGVPGRPFADALHGVFGPDALIARISETNFAVLMPQTNLFGARRQAEMLRARLAAGTIHLSMPARTSIGLAEHEPGDSLSDMAFRAQWALDEARRAGGNAIRRAARSALATGYGAG